MSHIIINITTGDVHGSIVNIGTNCGAHAATPSTMNVAERDGVGVVPGNKEGNEAKDDSPRDSPSVAHSGVKPKRDQVSVCVEMSSVGFKEGLIACQRIMRERVRGLLVGWEKFKDLLKDPTQLQVLDEGMCVVLDSLVSVCSSHMCVLFEARLHGTVPLRSVDPRIVSMELLFGPKKPKLAINNLVEPSSVYEKYLETQYLEEDPPLKEDTDSGDDAVDSGEDAGGADNPLWKLVDERNEDDEESQCVHVRTLAPPFVVESRKNVENEIGRFRIAVEDRYLDGEAITRFVISHVFCEATKQLGMGCLMIELPNLKEMSTTPFPTSTGYNAGQLLRRMAKAKRLHGPTKQFLEILFRKAIGATTEDSFLNLISYGKLCAADWLTKVFRWTITSFRLCATPEAVSVFADSHVVLVMQTFLQKNPPAELVKSLKEKYEEVMPLDTAGEMDEVITRFWEEVCGLICERGLDDCIDLFEGLSKMSKLTASHRTVRQVIEVENEKRKENEARKRNNSEQATSSTKKVTKRRKTVKTETVQNETGKKVETVQIEADTSRKLRSHSSK